MPESETTELQAPTITVRPATADDVEGIGALIEPFVAHKRLLPRTADELEDLISCGFVAVVDDQVVGFAALEIYSKKLAEVRSLCVSSDFQRHGIGRRLVEACVGRARERHIFEVMAITSTDDFFRSCGFDFTLPGEKKALFLQTRDEP
ncbi:MAG: GNAT family N-acetyltransferase [Planctomycetaceae bacterium]|nr:GNAT family N-acetyltransferase [Planctomycetaceae bacterium]